MKKKLDYSQIILVILAGSILGGVLLAFLPSLFPRTYQISFTLEVIPNLSQGDFYNYDGFYALQAAEIASSDIAKWFISPVFVERILSANESETLSELSVRDLRRIISSEQISNSLVEITYETDSEELAKDRYDAISSVINERVRDRELNFKVESLEPTIRPKTYVRAFWFLAGVVLGALVSGISLYVSRYLRS